jgi:spore cortex formation protein SpoVR/YcgB (stage V sporulation)
MHNGRPLERENAEEVVRHLHQLWGFDVILESVSDDKVMSSVVHSQLASTEA